MSQNPKLSDEHKFIYDFFKRAASMSYMDGNPETMPSTSLIQAGGSIRDLYFKRPAKDVDLYFDSTTIDPHEYARSLKMIDIDAMARQYGFSSARLVRFDEPQLKERDDVAQRQTHAAVAYAQQLIQSMAAGGSLPGTIPTLYGSVQAVSAAPSGSASGSKIGRVHPLKSIETFGMIIDERQRINIELMAVAMSPVDYVMTNFAVKLSRCFYDGNVIKYTPDFFTDVRNKTITVACRVEHARFERLFSYYLPKLKSYFPDFDVRIDLDSMNRYD